jgi:uncharacterized protein
VEELYTLHQQYLKDLNIKFRRSFIDTINWDEQLIAIQGARGVGKSTIMLQYIKEVFNTDEKALYVSMDHFSLKNIKLYDIAQYHYERGGTHLFVDEIHKYLDWSIELKSIYDTFSRLRVVITSSSILQIYKGYADLSRRVITYHLNGLSLREFIQIEANVQLPIVGLDELLSSHVKIASEIASVVKPLAFFEKYVSYGYYPFYLQGQKGYYQKLNGVLNTILEVDVPYILNVNVSNVFKMKKLIATLAAEIPFQPNTTKLAASLELSRSTLNTYLHYLDSACIFKLLLAEGKYYSSLSKPEKIYLNNTNLCYALSPKSLNIGTIREVFFINQVSACYQINSSKQGDFLVDGKYVFEVGGSNKSFDQIANLPFSYLATDKTEIGSGNRIPLWLFGFLY